MNTTVAQSSDFSLVAQVLVLHRQQAFGQLVEKHQASIRRFFLQHTGGDTMRSDDLAQETFIKAYTHLTQFKATAKFSTWLFRIAYNVLLDDVRKNETNNAQCELNDNSRVMPTINSIDHNTHLQMDLTKALSLLNANERICVTLQLSEGQSLEDISKITSMPLGSVKANLSRGKAKMAQYLKANGYE